MNEEEIEKIEKEIKKENSDFDKVCKRAERILDINYKLSKPKGIFYKKCPKCGKRLKYKILLTNPFRYLALYQCECGYEYVLEKSNCVPV